MDIDPGTVVANRYRISRPLGRGGMGEVFAAENIRTGRPVAVKLLRSDSKAKSSAVARFRQEARAAGSINSDHVTQVLDVEEDSEHGVVLVFELLEGESLIDRLKRTGPIPFDELHSIVEQVWLGLADAHRVGIVHRDLKPSNVFLEHRPDGTTRVKILDFGISKLPKEMGGETLTEMGQSLGTFSFMPPEQIGKAKTVDHRADIYACATMIYQSLTGQLPYSARNILVMVEMKSKTEARKLSEAMGGPVDPRLEAFVAQGLARDLTKRFQTANEALAAWRDLKPGRGDPTSSQRPAVVSQRAPSEAAPKKSISSSQLAAVAPYIPVASPSAPTAVDGPPELDMGGPMLDMPTDSSAATLAMPMPQLTGQAEAPPRVAPRIDAPMSVPRKVGLGGTQPVMSVARPQQQGPASSAAPSSGPAPSAGAPPSSGAQSRRLTGTIAINEPVNPVKISHSHEQSTYDEPKSGNLQPHPAGYYMPPSVAAALAQQSSRNPALQTLPSQAGASQGGASQSGPAEAQTNSASPGHATPPQVVLPRLFDDPTSIPVSSSSDKTTVYRPQSSHQDEPLRVVRVESTVKYPRKSNAWAFALGAVAFLLVGFFVVAAIMRYMTAPH